MRLIGALVMLGLALNLNAFAEKGVASWYGNPYHGRKAADGSVYNMYKMTCAHKTLPFGTKVLVENVKTKQSVILKVTDRGPFVKGRVLDVSKVAAVKLGMIKSGTSLVKITILPKNGLQDKTEDLEVAKTESPVAQDSLVQDSSTQVELAKDQADEKQSETLTSAQEKEQLLKEMDKITARLKELDDQSSQ